MGKELSLKENQGVHLGPEVTTMTKKKNIVSFSMLGLVLVFYNLRCSYHYSSHFTGEEDEA